MEMYWEQRNAYESFSTLKEKTLQNSEIIPVRI